MKIKKQDNETAGRFIKETISLIEEKGGSKNVNLREISKKVGCAHTNAYNYFDGFEGLMWAAFEEALKIYGNAMITGLNSKMSGYKYFNRLIKNLIDFAIHNSGLYRFIASDPIDYESIPEALMSLIIKLKQYFIDIIILLSKEKLTEKESHNTADIILAYLDGETLNLINERFLPEEDINARILSNVDLLFTSLTSKNCDGIILRKDASKPGVLNFPVLEI